METVLPSVCPLDCPDTCSLSVTVRDGKVAAVRGSMANPYTRGVLCNKVTRYYPEWVHGKDRLTHPLIRAGRKGEGKFRAASWEQALDVIHEQVSLAIAQHGPQSVLPLNYAGPHGMLAYASMDRRFFHKLGASLLDRAPLCGGVRNESYASLFGAVPGMRPEQLDASNLIWLWGNNVTWTNLHLMPLLQQAQKRGAKVIVSDPRRTRVAEQAGLWLPLRPGTDVVLAWAVAAELERRGALDRKFIAENVIGAEAFLELARAYTPEKAEPICGVAAADIRRAAEWFATISPAVVSLGNGPERSRNGGSGMRSVMALPALAGKFGVRGGGVMNGHGFSFPKTPAKLMRTDLVPPGTRTLNIVDVPRHLSDPKCAPPIRALFFYNHNPLIVLPEQNRMREGLEREDLFTVGIDVVLTDSLAYADVVLPASSHFEYGDIYPAYGQQWLQRAERVIPPVGDSLPNMEIFRRLAARFGFDDPLFRASDKELMDEALDPADPRMLGLSPSILPTRNALDMRVAGRDEAILFKTHRPATPSGKIEIESAALKKKFGQGLPSYEPNPSRFPLWLVSPASNKRTTSTFGNLSHSDGTPEIEMHPDDARLRGLAGGQTVRVWNDLGEVHLTLRVTEAVRPGVLCSHKGAWLRTSSNGQTVNALVADGHADIAGGGCFNDTKVEVAALGN